MPISPKASFGLPIWQPDNIMAKIIPSLTDLAGNLTVVNGNSLLSAENIELIRANYEIIMKPVMEVYNVGKANGWAILPLLAGGGAIAIENDGFRATFADPAAAGRRFAVFHHLADERQADRGSEEQPAEPAAEDDEYTLPADVRVLLLELQRGVRPVLGYVQYLPDCHLSCL